MLGPLDSTPPLTLTSTAAADAVDGADATLRFRAVAVMADGASLSTEASSTLTVVTPASHGVSARIGPFTSASVAAPATQTVPLTFTPIGRGDLSHTVTVTLNTPKGVTADFAAATTDDRWTCTKDGCRTTGVLPGGTPNSIDVPVTVTTDAAPGVHSLEVVAEVDGGETDRAAAGLTVVPPPAPELRASMRSAAAEAGAAPALAGAALQFAPREPRDVKLVVTNLGTRPAPAGSQVDVEAWPDVAQRVEQLGDDRWSCTKPGEATTRRHVRCTLELTEDLPSNASLELPIRLGPTGTGHSTWTLRSGLDGHRPTEGSARYRIEVGERLARLVPTAHVVHELVDDGVGSVELTLTNRGVAPATGAVLLVEIPPGVSPGTIEGEGWTCVDTSLRHARGTLRCTNPDLVAPSASTPPLQVELYASTDEPQVELWMWATAPGQFHRSGPRAGTTLTLDVHRAPSMHAGDDLTVVTPVLGPDGVRRPAVVVLHGQADPSLRSHTSWTQRCTAAGERGCDAVSPVVTWSDVAPGATPTTPTARFTAPSVVDEPMTLHFRFTAGDGRNAHHEDVTVHLVPAATDGDDTADSSRERERRRDAARAGSRSGPTGDGDEGTPSAAVPVTVQVGDGSTLQVPTRTGAVLRASASGAGTLQYRWVQTSGPTAKVLGDATSSNLSFTAPDLKPDQTSTSLTWRLDVTDAAGTTNSADTRVQVVWGDDGLKVVLADGAPSAIGTIDGPVVVTSAVSSAGAPYTYSWSLGDGDIDLPAGTATDRPDLSFTAADEPGSSTARLRVEDSFGRVTTTSIDLDITELPAGMVPVALCQSISDLQAGTPTTLNGPDAGVSVTIPFGTANSPKVPTTTTTVAPSTSTTSTTTTTTTSTTTTAPSDSSTTTPSSTSTTASTTTTTAPPTCAATAVATFSDATVQAPGGIVLTRSERPLVDHRRHDHLRHRHRALELGTRHADRAEAGAAGTVHLLDRSGSAAGFAAGHRRALRRTDGLVRHHHRDVLCDRLAPRRGRRRRHPCEGLRHVRPGRHAGLVRRDGADADVTRSRRTGHRRRPGVGNDLDQRRRHRPLLRRDRCRHRSHTVVHRCRPAVALAHMDTRGDDRQRLVDDRRRR